MNSVKKHSDEIHSRDVVSTHCLKLRDVTEMVTTNQGIPHYYDFVLFPLFNNFLLRNSKLHHRRKDNTWW